MKAVAPAKRGRPVDAGLAARRRAEILAAASKLFAKFGYAQTDTQKLADVLQIGKGTIYRYYPSKAKLFGAALDRGMDRLHERVNLAVAGIDDPVERITQAIHSFLAHFEEEPELVELFLQELAYFKHRRKPAYFAYHDLHVGPWRDMYRRMIQDGRVREIPGAPDHDVVNDLLYGTIIANYVSGRRVPFREQARKIIDIVYLGILTDKERRRTNDLKNKRQSVPRLASR